MRTLLASLVGAALVLQGCPSAYQRTYDRETQRLEGEQRAADERAKAEHGEASRYAAVVYFAVGSSAIGADGERELRWFVQRIQPYPQAVVLVQGFADTTGDEAENRSLSGARARAVADFLGKEGITPSRLVAEGYGTQSPATTNATRAGADAESPRRGHGALRSSC
jgi:outer membrane protein OmpA-like peptidoglycan-associated protein